MNEVKNCLKWLILYSLFLALNIICFVGISPFRFPTDTLSALYFIILSVCLIIRYYKCMSGQEKLKASMKSLSIMIFLLFLLRGIKYTVVGSVSVLGRYTWYLYYLPMLFIPMLFFFASLFVFSTDERKERRQWSWVFFVTIFLVLFVLTNDFHQMVFRFQPGFQNWDGDYSYGIGFYVVSAWEYLMYLAAVVILIAKSSIPKIRHRVVIILLPFLAGIALILLSITGKMPKINGYAIVEFPEALCFMVATVLECCIQLGLIPTNESYGKLMRVTSVPVMISDCNGKPVYQSDAARDLTEEQLALPDKTRIAEHTLLRRMAIHGGNGFWQEDVGDLDNVNAELAETKERLSEEVELIRLQNELEKKKNVIEQRSYVYDTIAKRTQRESQKITELADESLESSDIELKERNRKQIILLGAYIKRYANLMLISSDNKTIDVGELSLSISELLRYMHQFGISVELLNDADGFISAEAVLGLFEVFHAITEKNIFFLSGVTVNFTNQNIDILCRLTFEGLRDNISEEDKKKLSLSGISYKEKCEDGITYISFLMPKRG